MFQAMSSDAEAKNLKSNTVVLMTHLGAYLVVWGFICHPKRADRRNSLQRKYRLIARKKGKKNLDLELVKKIVPSEFNI